MPRGRPKEYKDVDEKSVFTPEEREKRNRIFETIMRDYLSKPALLIDELAADIKHHYPDVSYAEAIAIAMLRRGVMGDVGAATFVRDTIGENPKQIMELSSGPKPFEVKIEVVEKID